MVVQPYGHGQRLDSYLSKYVGGRSRSAWQRLVVVGAVLLEGKPTKPSARLGGGERIALLPLPAHLELAPAEDIPLDVVYEDRAIIVVNKAPGVVVHPAPGHESGTLVNALLHRFPELRDYTGALRPGIVHRLDKDTSGLMVIGKTAAAVTALQQQFKERTAEKRYLLLVHGRIAEDQGMIEGPIGRHPRDRQRMAIRADGKPAETRFVVLERFKEYTLVEAEPLTGRTHQLRVHFAHIGHPVAGDTVYGPARKPPGLARQFVHARYLAIRSPVDGRRQEFEIDLASDLKPVLEQLRRQG